MDAIFDIGRRYRVPVIEDATESLGSRYKGRHAGSLANSACLSFNGNKIITAGGGGMVLTDDDRLASLVRHLTTQARTDSIEYIHDQVGHNYRLPNVNAALGLAQLEQIDEFIAAKRRIGCAYRQAFEAIDEMAFMPEASWASANYWLNTVLLPSKSSMIDRSAVIQALNVRGIQARPLWRPVHQLPVYVDFQAYKISVADALYLRGVSLPSSATLTRTEQDFVIGALSSELLNQHLIDELSPSL